MRPRRRIHKVARWGGLIAAGLVAAIWLGSARWCAGWVTYPAGVQNPAIRLYIERGLLGVGVWNQERLDTGLWFRRYPSDVVVNLPDGLVQARHDHRLRWNFKWVAIIRIMWIPLWAPFSLLVVLAALAWRPDIVAARRRGRGHCRTCNYDRSGLAPSAPCPECGQVPA